MTRNSFTKGILTAFAALGIASTSNASTAPTLTLTCYFKTAKPDVRGAANLVLDLARLKATSSFRLASVATVGGERILDNVESFRQVGNQYELILKSKASAPYIVDGSITLHFSEFDVNEVIAGKTSKLPVSVAQTDDGTGEVSPEHPCTLDPQHFESKDAAQDPAVDPFARNVQIETPTATLGQYPIWKDLRTPNFEIFCVKSLPHHAFGIDWPLQETCEFNLLALKTADGKYFYRDLVGDEAAQVYNALPNHKVALTGMPGATSPGQPWLLDISVSCDSPQHCLVKAKAGPAHNHN